MAVLRERAAEHGARFRLVFVRPPREARIEVTGIEAALAEALRRHPPEGPNGFAAVVTIDAVSDVEVDAIEVRPDEAAIEGEATVTVSLIDAAGQNRATDSLPFALGVVLDRKACLKDVTRLEVDTSSWFGATDAGDAAEGNGRSDIAAAASTAGAKPS